METQIAFLANFLKKNRQESQKTFAHRPKYIRNSKVLEKINCSSLGSNGHLEINFDCPAEILSEGGQNLFLQRSKPTKTFHSAKKIIRFLQRISKDRHIEVSFDIIPGGFSRLRRTVFAQDPKPMKQKIIFDGKTIVPQCLPMATYIAFLTTRLKFFRQKRIYSHSKFEFNKDYKVFREN